jgi:hypothetical protein
MSEISAQVELKVKVSAGQDPDALERAIAAEGRRAAKELYLRVIETKDEQAVAVTGGARQRREARWVATLFGRVRIHRYRINNEVESFHPLDPALGLRRSEASSISPGSSVRRRRDRGNRNSSKPLFCLRLPERQTYVHRGPYRTASPRARRPSGGRRSWQQLFTNDSVGSMQSPPWWTTSATN